MGESTIVKKITKGMTYNLLRVIASIVINPIYSIIVVRQLQVENFGSYAFLSSIFSTMGTIRNLGIMQTILRFVPELVVQKDYLRLRRLLSICKRVIFTSSLVMFIIMFPFADQLANLLGHPDMAFYVRLMALGIIPGVLYGVFRNILDASYEQKFINILGIGLLLLNFIAMIVFVILANLGLSGYIFVGIIEAILGSCICLYWIMKKFPTLLKGDNEMLGKELKHRVMRYSITSLFFSLASQFISKPSENIFLGIFRKLEEVTYYDVSYTFAQTVLVEIQSVIGSLGLISLVEISTMNLDKIKLAIRQYVKLISIYVIPMSIGGILLAKPIMVVFYGNQMSPAAVPFQAFMILFCLNNLLYINDVILRTYEKISYLLVWRIIGAIVLLILDLLMIPTFGITGAILANFITLLLSCI